VGKKPPLDLYVDTKGMLDSFSKTIIFKQMPPPKAPTLFVELAQFQPGSDGSESSSVSASRPKNQRPPPPPPQSYPLNQGPSYSHHNPIHHPISIQHAPPVVTTFQAVPTAAPPPPPWSRWGTMSTPSMPPSTQRRAPNGEGPRSNSNAAANRKRKHMEEMQHHPPPAPAEDDNRSNNSSFPLKRHAGPALTPTPVSPPRPTQTLSPSLAMIVSPTNQAVHTSPRGNQLPPMMRNGPGGSPLLPPVKSLIGGDSRGPL